jgi:outer membrane protein TolC
LIVLCSVGTIAGCANLQDIDRETDELIRERSALLRETTVIPNRPLAQGVNDPAARRFEPPTVNPPAEELTFKPADEARDVAKRLELFSANKGEPRSLSFPEALKVSQQTGREFLSAEEDYILAAIRLLISRHQWHPQFFLNSTAQVTSANVTGTPSTTALNVIQELRATQRLPFGGTVEASYVYSLTEQLRQVVTERYAGASSFVLNANIPLLRGAGDIAREDLIQAERELVYAARRFEDFRRTYLVSIARDYFNLVQQQRQITNQENALALLKRLQERTEALVQAGRLAEFERNIAASDVLRATQSLSRQRESLILALDRFKIRLGLSVDQPIALALDSLTIPEPDTTPEEATASALEYRLDLQTRRDIVDDAKRTVRNAENQLLPDLNAFATVNTGRFGNQTRDAAAFVNPDPARYSAGVTLSIPLDKDAERLALRAAHISAEQRTRDYEQFRDNVIVEVRSRVREIERARFALQLAEQSVQINKRRQQEQELKADEVTAQQVVDTANALRDAENSRDAALTDLRIAVLDYLQSAGLLRVSREGQLEMLPGMR